MTKRFKSAYDALVRAYFEGTLAKGTCVACACGNIIFDAIGEPLVKDDLLAEINHHCDRRADGRTDKDMAAFALWGTKRTRNWGIYEAREHYIGEVNQAGYKTEEFAMIENAFEGNTKIQFVDYNRFTEQAVLEDQYRGLCAVVDVLIQLDETEENPDELKKKFREHPKLQVA